jgi:hypothetical protein
MQLQLQAAGGNSSATPAGELLDAPLLQAQAAPAQLSMDAQQQQLVPAAQGVPGAGVQATPGEADADAEAAAAAAAEASQLREALVSAEQHVSVLSDENERLMDLSNGLRAENEGLKKALNLQQVGGMCVCVLEAG